jgi:signal transduction histidine kinase
VGPSSIIGAVVTGSANREATGRPRPEWSAGSLPSLLAVVRVVGLGLLLWALWGEVHPGASGEHLAAWVLALSTVPAWLLWTGGRSGRLQLAAFAWLGLAGGAVGGMAPIGLALVGTAALGVATAYELPAALGLAALGPAALGVTVAFDGRSPSLVLAAVAAGLGGLVLGAGRRQHALRAEQAVRVAFERDRAEVERQRAEVLAERNRLAREVHDVLAHTLGALSVQLEALDARLGAEPAAAGPLRDGIRRTKALASEGLDEARRAVRALRDDAVPLRAQLERLCDLRGAALDVEGDERPLSPETTLALYRVAQEGLTNAGKHAPGSAAAVRLRFGQGAVDVAVENGPGRRPPGGLAASGGGYGLDGIRERLRLLGGDVTAAPEGAGWRLHARVAE